MGESPALRWDVLPSWYIQPVGLIVLGVATCVIDVLPSSDAITGADGALRTSPATTQTDGFYAALIERG